MSARSNHQSPVLAAVMCTVAFIASTSAAQSTFTWQGSGTGGVVSTDAADPHTAFAQPENWQVGGITATVPPGASDSALVQAINAGCLYLGAGTISSLSVSGVSGFDVRATGTTDFNLNGTIRLGTAASEVGQLSQSGGSINAVSVYVGRGGTGTFDLSGGTLSIYSWSLIGRYSPATFHQSGGTHTTGDLSIGYGTTSANLPQYIMDGGELFVTPVVHSSDPGLKIGDGGSGLLVLNGGTITSYQAVLISAYALSASSGTLLMSGGTLNTPHLYVGEANAGTMSHSAGTVQATQLHIGYIGSSAGTYTLSGTGILNSEVQRIGDGAGAGTLIQTGGTNNVQLLNIRAGWYGWKGGTLNLNGGLELAGGATATRGKLDFDNRAVSIDGGDGFMLQIHAADAFANSSNAELHLGYDSLLLVPDGYDPASELKAFSNLGLTRTLGQTIVFTDSEGFTGNGSFYQPGVIPLVRSSGHMLARPNGQIDIEGHAEFTGNASINLGKGTWKVTGGTYSNKSLIQDNAVVQLRNLQTSAALTQSGGTLLISGGANLAGSYLHSGGYAHAGATGVSSNGNFSISNGTYQTGQFTVGGYSDILSFPGYASITGGELRTDRTVIGSDPSLYSLIESTMLHYGGTHSIATDLLVGGDDTVGSIGVGTYTMYGGTLSVGRDLKIGPALIGTYEHFFGDVHVGRNLEIGRAVCGDYTIMSGTLCVDGDLLVGYDPLTGGGGVGTLTLADAAASVHVGGHLMLGNGAAINAVAGSAIHLCGSDSRNFSKNPAALAGLALVEFIFEGGSAAPPDELEVAGMDRGCVEEGLTNNFALGTLHIGSATAAGNVRLVGQFDNLPGWEGIEALYVDTLLLGAASVLDLNGLNLYYRHATIDPTATVIGGTPIQVPEPIAPTAAIAVLTATMSLRRPRRLS